MRLVLTPLIALTALTTSVGALRAQSSQPPVADRGLFLSSSSDLVVLPVVVTDRQDRFVADLAQDRFVVLDNGRPQAIALFTNEDTPVTVGLVIDDSRSMAPKLAEVIAAAAAFARSSPILWVWKRRCRRSWPKGGRRCTMPWARLFNAPLRRRDPEKC